LNECDNDHIPLVLLAASNCDGRRSIGVACIRITFNP
jgi:hypothetical protein